jgi:uncharacterized protein YwqG
VGLFDFFSKKNTPTVSVTPVNPLLEMVEVKPGIKIARAFANEWPALEASRLDFVSIEAVPVESMKLEQSKFGHYPKIPAGFAYPKGSNGEYMYPLAQINFGEVAALAGYPTSGFLQFYISVDEDAYGMDFEDGQSQKDFRVLYFEAHEVENHETDFSFLQDIMTTNNSPVYKPHALSFVLKEEYIGLSDVRYDDNAGKTVLQISQKYPDIADDLEESLYDDFESNGHKIGGYAYFTQSDPREYNEPVKDYILLLQIDTDEEIMWGDSGVANFFIHPDDLAKKDFSKVMYNWDCC